MQTARWYEPKSLAGCEIPTLAAVSSKKIEYPKKDIKSPSSTVAYAAIYSRNEKMKHTNKLKLTEEEKGKVQNFSEAKVPLYRHFGRTSGQLKLAT
jgi:hypothetical protein